MVRWWLVGCALALGGCADDGGGGEIAGTAGSGDAGTDVAGDDVPDPDGPDDDDDDDDDDDGAPTTMGGDETGGPCIDTDGDGFAPEACGGLDCDDADATVYPSAPDAGWGGRLIAPRGAEPVDIGVTTADDGTVHFIAVGVVPGEVSLGFADAGVWVVQPIPAAGARDVSIFAAPDGLLYAAYVADDIVYYGRRDAVDGWYFEAAPTEPGPVLGTTVTWDEAFGTSDLPGAGAVIYGRPEGGHGWAALLGDQWMAGSIDMPSAQGVYPDAVWWDGGTPQHYVVSFDEGAIRRSYYTGVGVQGTTVAELAAGPSAIAGTNNRTVIFYTDEGGAVHSYGPFGPDTPVLGPDGAALSGDALDLDGPVGDIERVHAAVGGDVLYYGRSDSFTFVDNPVFQFETIDDTPVDALSIVAATPEVVDILYWTDEGLEHAALRPADGLDNDCDGIED